MSYISISWDSFRLIWKLNRLTKWHKRLCKIIVLSAIIPKYIHCTFALKLLCCTFGLPILLLCINFNKRKLFLHFAITIELKVFYNLQEQSYHLFLCLEIYHWSFTTIPNLKAMNKLQNFKQIYLSNDFWMHYYHFQDAQNDKTHMIHIIRCYLVELLRIGQTNQFWKED